MNENEKPLSREELSRRESHIEGLKISANKAIQMSKEIFEPDFFSKTKKDRHRIFEELYSVIRALTLPKEERTERGDYIEKIISKEDKEKFLKKMDGSDQAIYDRALAGDIKIKNRQKVIHGYIQKHPWLIYKKDFDEKYF